MQYERHGGCAADENDPVIRRRRPMLRPGTERGLQIDEFRESRKFVSESRVRIPLQSLAAEPAFDSLGDCLPPRLKHHDVPHVGEQFGIGLVKAR
jgi:hypothetical protein